MPREIVAGLQPKVEPVRTACCLGRHDSLQPQLDALCSAYIVEALRAMGCPLQAGDSLRASAQVTRCGIAEGHGKLFLRLLSILEEDGILQGAAPEDWLVQRTAPSQDTALIVAALRQAYPDYAAELNLTERCGVELVAVLRGEADPLQLLFPGGSIDELESLYSQSPSAVVAQRFGSRCEVTDVIAGFPEGQDNRSSWKLVRAQVGRRRRLSRCSRWIGPSTPLPMYRHCF